MKKDFMLTSESVTPGHPDKLCDQISDAIVDRILRQNPRAQIIAECAVSSAIIFLAARFEPNISVDFTGIARRIISEVGYDGANFNGKDCSVLTSFEELPPDQHHNFNESSLSDPEIEEITVKNQATVFGFACNQTATLMPLPIWLAHKLARKLHQVKLDDKLAYLSPDGKTQVGIEYRDRVPHRIHSMTILANQTDLSQPSLTQVRDDIYQAVIEPVFADEEIKPDSQTRIFINPSGVSKGGPHLHSGLTGRKNAIDTYGEYSKHSGAALSGKDPIRIDRIGAYAARYAAKNVVAAKLAGECEVQLSYSIGLPRPVSVQIETFGTSRVPEEKIKKLVEQHFDFRLAGIMKHFQLRYLPSQRKGGFYQKLAAYGHIGRADINLPWEQEDKVPYFN